MSYQILLKRENKNFTCNYDETILEAATRNSIQLPYSCKGGICGSCKGNVYNGIFSYRNDNPKGITEIEKKMGLALFCSVEPRSDLVIDIQNANNRNMTIKKTPCRILSIKYVTKDIAIVKLQLPESERFQFIAGQYIEFLLKNNQRRAYSLANSPNQVNPLELHIRHIPGGVFTNLLFDQNKLKEKDILRFEGPLGTFSLQENTEKPIIFLASGTGFAPIKSIIEYIKHKKIKRTMTLYWMGRYSHDLYQEEICEIWKSELFFFQYTPLIFEKFGIYDNTDCIKLAYKIIMQDFPNMSEYQVYACGSPEVIESAKLYFVQECKLPENQFFSDIFINISDLEKNKLPLLQSSLQSVS